MHNYTSIYHKIGIYNRNIKYIHEGYNYPDNITFTISEKHLINEMLGSLQNLLIYLDLSEGIINKDSIQASIKKLVDKLEPNIIKAYTLLDKAITNGINNVKQFIKVIGKFLSILGDKLSDIFNKLGLYSDDFLKLIPDNIKNYSFDKSLDLNQRKLINFIIYNVEQGINNKKVISELQLNESNGKKIAAVGGAIAISQISLLPVSILCGGYLTYKTLKKIGPALSNKLEPYLLNDKVKNFATSLYKNPIAKYGLGLSKIDNTNLSKLQMAGEVLKSIFLNLIIAFLITQVISLFVSSVFAGSPFIPLIVSIIISGKNIFRIIINRILIFDKTKVKQDARFFDILTMVSIIFCFSNVILNVPIIKEELTKLVSSLYNGNLSIKGKSEILQNYKFNVVDYDGNKMGEVSGKVIGTYGNGKYVAIMNPNDGKFYKVARFFDNTQFYYYDEIPLNELDKSTVTDYFKQCIQIIGQSQKSQLARNEANTKLINIICQYYKQTKFNNELLNKFMKEFNLNMHTSEYVKNGVYSYIIKFN